MSLKLVPFESMVTVSYSPSIVTMALCCSISKIRQNIGRKFLRYVYSFWHDPRAWQTDRQTRLCIASRGKNRQFLRTTAFVFFSPGDRRLCGNHAKRCINEMTIQCLTHPSQHAPIYLQQFPSYSNRNGKKSTFSRTTFFPWRRPCDYNAKCCMYRKTII